MILSRDNTLLGLAFDGRLMSAVVARRSGDRVEAGKHCQARLSLDPIGSEPALAGREIKTQLEAAGIRTRRCVVAIPVSWALTGQVPLPELSGSDLESYLALQAEREFPFPPADLSLSISKSEAGDGTGHALITALPLNRLRVLESTLHAAGLKPVSITFAVTSLARKTLSGTGALVIASENAVDLCVLGAAGVMALRALEGPSESGSEGFEFDTDSLGRELRITLRRMPPEVSQAVRRLHIGGAPALASVLEAELSERGALSGIEPKRLNDSAGDACATPAFSAAENALHGDATDFEFLPPRVSRLKHLASSAANRSLRWLVPAAAGLALVIGAMFLYQHYRLNYLERRWDGVRDEVVELSEIQDNIRAYRDWFSSDAASLKLTEGLTEAFPESGSAWARAVSLRERDQVTCLGSARSNEAWLEVLGKLNEDERVTNLKVGQVSGDTPLQFTFSYRWKEQ